LHLIDTAEPTSPQSTGLNSTETDLKLRNLESLVGNNHRAIINAISHLKAELIEEISAQLPKPLPPLEAFNRILEPEIAVQVQRKLESALQIGKAKKVMEKLQEVSKNKNHTSFQNFAEVLAALKIEQKGKLVGLISAEKMLVLIDRWNG
jgi:histidyl-tRNA synthetase